MRQSSGLSQPAWLARRPASPFGVVPSVRMAGRQSTKFLNQTVRPSNTLISSSSSGSHALPARKFAPAQRNVAISHRISANTIYCTAGRSVTAPTISSLHCTSNYNLRCRNDTERVRAATNTDAPSTHWLSAHADKLKYAHLFSVYIYQFTYGLFLSFVR